VEAIKIQTSLIRAAESLGLTIIPVEPVPSITQETAESSSQALWKNRCQQLAKAMVEIFEFH
jgi:hypothetical protein